MSDLFPITRDEEIGELTRELGMRRRVYADLVASGRMSQTKSDRQIALLESAIESLHRLKGLEK